MPTLDQNELRSLTRSLNENVFYYATYYSYKVLSATVIRLYQTKGDQVRIEGFLIDCRNGRLFVSARWYFLLTLQG